MSIKSNFSKSGIIWTLWNKNKVIKMPLDINPKIPYYVNITNNGANIYHFKWSLRELGLQFKDKSKWIFIPESNFNSSNLEDKSTFIAKACAYWEFHFHPEMKPKIRKIFKTFDKFWAESDRYKNWSSNDEEVQLNIELSKDRTKEIYDLFANEFWGKIGKIDFAQNVINWIKNCSDWGLNPLYFGSQDDFNLITQEQSFHFVKERIENDEIEDYPELKEIKDVLEKWYVDYESEYYSEENIDQYYDWCFLQYKFISDDKAYANIDLSGLEQDYPSIHWPGTEIFLLNCPISEDEMEEIKNFLENHKLTNEDMEELSDLLYGISNEGKEYLKVVSLPDLKENRYWYIIWEFDHKEIENSINEVKKWIENKIPELEKKFEFEEKEDKENELNGKIFRFENFVKEVKTNFKYYEIETYSGKKYKIDWETGTVLEYSGNWLKDNISKITQKLINSNLEEKKQYFEQNSFVAALPSWAVVWFEINWKFKKASELLSGSQSNLEFKEGESSFVDIDHWTKRINGNGVKKITTVK